MASPFVDISSGFTITFPQSTFTAEIVNVKPPGGTVNDIQVTHQGTDPKIHKFVPSDFIDNGEMTLGCHFNPDSGATIKSPLGVIETAIVLTHPSGATWTFPGYCNSFEPGEMALDEKMMVELTVKVTGLISISDGS